MGPATAQSYNIPHEYQKSWGDIGVALIQDIINSTPIVTVQFADRVRQVQLCYATQDARELAVYKISQMVSVAWSPVATRDGNTTVVVTLTYAPDSLKAMEWNMKHFPQMTSGTNI